MALIVSSTAVYYDHQDNQLYRLAYDSFLNLNFSESFLSYKNVVGSSEPVYFIISYLFSFIISYDVFILIINIIFLISIFHLFKFYFNNYYLIYIITLLTDFYLYIFLTNTHRLALAIIFFVLYLTSKKSKMIFLILSFLSQLQIVFCYIYTLIVKMKINRSMVVKKR